MGKDKHKATEKDKDEANESCGKCHTYDKGKDDRQGLRRNGQRQRERERRRQPRRQRQRQGIESCGKCHTYDKGTDERQGMRK